MKSFLKLFLVPILGLFFLPFIFSNKNLNLNEDNINYQNNKINDYSEYSENSISSQQFIYELESVPDWGTYELEHNVDFSDSENDDVTGLELNKIIIEGNGYTLYNRDVTDIFNTNTFEVSEANNGLGYYSFFSDVNSCSIFNLNFDNFMFPFGEINESFLTNVNFYNINYQNLIFNVYSPNIIDREDYDNKIINIATIGLIAQNIFGTNFENCAFENINFSNNKIILFDETISTIIAPIGNSESYILSEYHFDDIYINNINFSNNQFISSFSNNLFIEDEGQEKYFSIFYSPFIGSVTNGFQSDEGVPNSINLDEVIFNNINVNGNSNDFANYTFYSLLPPISSGISFNGENIYGFNLNLDIQSQLDNNENIAVGNLSSEGFYLSEDFYYTGIYQTDWIDDVYYQNIALDYTSFSDNESMIKGIYQNNGSSTLNELTDFWYYDKLSINQDYSLVLVDKPTIIYKYDSFYDQNEKTNDIYFKLLDGRNSLSRNDYYANYTINLINKDNNEIIWNEYVDNLLWLGAGEFEASIDLELLFENNLYFEISNDYHIWEQDVNFRKYLPKVYNVSNTIDNNDLIVSYDFVDPYNLINSINISLYDSLNNQIETKTIDYNNLENNNYLDSKEVIFDTKIDDSNNYYLEFEVNCNNFDYYKSYDSPFYITTLDNNLIQYNENNDIQFKTESIIPPDNNESISWWIILLIVIFVLILLVLSIYIIYYFKKKSKKKIK
ncbi:hypothetical protein X271_00559 [Candidatus Hepatoplasma crinochetorum Av]|uniref:Uncharacterized protein n=1 Tax=Candidatus Hepatoplasma crinochetorum Av TaxID=1427984 RepID=W8GFU9_9MOLU|nr:hypothetical protein [Candidatus Hepatoplasma crinochetorum]AHK22659.1 hypothetical protein X271_00559 [Candidatus Hepatoplasma crinochetorum Av]